MVKMILALPSRIDVEKFSEMTKDILRGRYGKNSNYDGLWLYFNWMMYPEKISTAYAKGYSGKNTLRYYDIEADALDPVIISAIEDLTQMIGDADFAFVSDNKIIPQDWWRPYNKNFQKWNGEPHYCDDEALEGVRDDYEHLLKLLNGSKAVQMA